MRWLALGAQPSLPQVGAGVRPLLVVQVAEVVVAVVALAEGVRVPAVVEEAELAVLG